MGDSRPIAEQLVDLRRRADEDFLHPDALREPGRHQLDLREIGLRVSLTRSRYPNRPDGVDQYAVTLSRPELDRPPGNQEVAMVLASAFGDASTRGGRAIRWRIANQDVPGSRRRRVARPVVRPASASS